MISPCVREKERPSDRTTKIRELIDRQHSHASGDRWHPPRVGKIGPDRPAAALALVCGERIKLDTDAVRPLLTEVRAWGRWDQALVVGVGEYAEPNPDDECLRHSGHW